MPPVILHFKIAKNENGFDLCTYGHSGTPFESVPECIKFYTLNEFSFTRYSERCFCRLVHPVLTSYSRIHTILLRPQAQAQPPPVAQIDTTIPLLDQKWYYGSTTRDKAETILNDKKIFSFLVRKSESTPSNYVVSIK